MNRGEVYFRLLARNYRYRSVIGQRAGSLWINRQPRRGTYDGDEKEKQLVTQPVIGTIWAFTVEYGCVVGDRKLRSAIAWWRVRENLCVSSDMLP